MRLGVWRSWDRRRVLVQRARVGSLPTGHANSGHPVFPAWIFEPSREQVAPPVVAGYFTAPSGGRDPE
jgi:hypothetical protein